MANFPFKINNHPLDGTDGYPALHYGGATYSRQSYDGSSAGRNQNGEMIRDQIAQKDKWQLEFVPCTQTQMGNLLKELDNETFQFTYPNPLYPNANGGVSGKVITKTFYCGDRSAPVFQISPTGSREVGLWNNLTFDVIEV